MKKFFLLGFAAIVVLLILPMAFAQGTLKWTIGSDFSYYLCIGKASNLRENGTNFKMDIDIRTEKDDGSSNPPLLDGESNECLTEFYACWLKGFCTGSGNDFAITSLRKQQASAIISKTTGVVESYPVDLTITNGNSAAFTVDIEFVLKDVPKTFELTASKTLNLQPGSKEITYDLIGTGLTDLGFVIDKTGGYSLEATLKGTTIDDPRFNFTKRNDSKTVTFTALPDFASNNVPELPLPLVLLCFAAVFSLIAIKSRLAD